MRCPSCGTDNTPDSRFCGGCGAKTSTSRVAPTVKLSDDATFPTTSRPAPYAHPRSIPPTNAGRTPIHIPTPPPGTVGYGGMPSTNVERGPRWSEPANVEQGPRWSEPANAGERGPTFPPTDPSRFPTTTPGQPAGAPSPASIPPTQISPRAAPTLSSLSLSMAAAPQRRSSTVIAVIVILDLGLAGAGAMLLAKGLGGPPAAPHRPAAAIPVPASTSLEAPKPPPGASAFVAPSAVAVTDPGTTAPAGDSATAQPASASSSVPPPDTRGHGVLAAPSPKPASKHHAIAAPIKSQLAVTVGGARSDVKVTSDDREGPLDPYVLARSSVGAAVDAKAAGASGVFYLCHHNAGQVHGTVNIAFQVLPDGHVAHVSAVENTTGSDKLASCLGSTIASWTFPPHTGEPAEFVRPFKYD